MTREDGETFATRWADAWNARAIESENLKFDARDQVVAAEVFHGVIGPA